MKHIIQLLTCLLLFSCSISEKKETQVYNLQLLDVINDVPLDNVDVKLSWDIGCTHQIETVTGKTDENGMVSLTTHIDTDSINQLLLEDEFLAQHNINQSVFIEKEGYSIFEIFQDTAILQYRPSLAEEDIATVKMYENIPIKIITIDESPLFEDLVIVEYSIKQSHPNISFELHGLATEFLQKDGSDSLETPLFLAKEVKYNIHYALSTVDTLTDELDTFFMSNFELPIFSNLEEQVFEVKI